MDRTQFYKLSNKALERLESELAELEHEALDVDLAGDVLTLSFRDGGKFIINAHSAAEQIWMAADKNAWHFDYDEGSGRWIAHKTGDELMTTVAQHVGRKLGTTIEL